MRLIIGPSQAVHFDEKIAGKRLPPILGNAPTLGRRCIEQRHAQLARLTAGQRNQPLGRREDPFALQRRFAQYLTLLIGA